MAKSSAARLTCRAIRIWSSFISACGSTHWPASRRCSALARRSPLRSTPGRTGCFCTRICSTRSRRRTEECGNTGATSNPWKRWARSEPHRTWWREFLRNSGRNRILARSLFHARRHGGRLRRHGQGHGLSLLCAGAARARRDVLRPRPGTAARGARLACTDRGRPVIFLSRIHVNNPLKGALCAG